MKSKKILCILMVIVIIIAVVLVIMEIDKNKEIENNKEILKNIKTAFLNLENSKNYSYSVTEIFSDNTITKLLKDNKFCYKELRLYGDIDTKEVYKFNENDENYVDISEEYKDILENSYYSIYNTPSIITDLISYSDRASTEEVSKKVKIIEENYKEIDCYKIIYTLEDGMIDYTWIDKQTMLPIRCLWEDNNGKKYSEEKYEIMMGNVQDSDVTVPIE